MSEAALEKGRAEQSREEVFEGLRGEARKRAIVELVGQPLARPDVEGFVAALRHETARYWDAFVEPLISEHWPEVRQTPFYAKLKIGALQVYAPAPYTVVVLSRQRPLALRLLLGLCRWLRLPGVAIVAGLRILLPVYTRWCLRRENRRISLMAAFIAVADEAFDHHLEEVPPLQRCELLRGILDGSVTPPTASFRLLRALRLALDHGTSEIESSELDQAIEGCVRWGEAETRRALRLPDPEGLCHRGEGIRNGINGLVWSVRHYVGPDERRWMYDVSYFIQMMDDWIDLEKDLAQDVCTPVAEGRWNLDSVRASLEQTGRDVAEIARRNGETYPPYLKMVTEAYQWQVRDLLRNMVRGIAD